MTADRSAGRARSGSLTSFPPTAAVRPASWLALNGSAVPGTSASSPFPTPPAGDACTTAFPPPDAPPPLDAEPLPEQPAAAPAKPDTTMIVAGIHMNCRIERIETSVVVDGETGAGGVWFPNPVAALRRLFGLPVSPERNYT